MAEKWYQNSYRRNLIDMHIPDWNNEFFSKFDPENYISLLALAGVDTAYIYANSCVGICNWPTKIGHMHQGLKGRDILKELTEGCRRKNMNVIVYMNMWSKWAYETHPDWRVISQDGKGTLEFQWNRPGRYAVCCFNSPYRDYVLGLVGEICRNYEFIGLWIDMILWRDMCYCSSCRRRFMDETGSEIPDAVDWENPVWLSFLRKREQWNEEFFADIQLAARAIKPDISINCNSSYYPNYLMGESLNFFRMGDFIGGDFNSDRLSHSFECKFYNSVTKNKPFEFLGSVMEPTLREHSIMKSKEKLRLLMFSTLMNNGRYGFIDAIDPAGTLNRHVYEVMREIFDEEKKYEPYLSHAVEFCQDIGIYTNLESMIDPRDNGQRVGTALIHTPHKDSTQNTALTFIQRHIPFGILTKFDLADLAKFQAIIVPDLYRLDDMEITALREYVKNGGNLYVSGHTGLFDTDGQKVTAGQLADMSGVTYLGETDEEITFIRPGDDSAGLMLHYTHEHPLTLDSSQMLVVPDAEALVLGWLTLPYVNPKDTRKFASAISDPPGIQTGYPSIICKKYGQGKVIYSAGALEAMKKDDQRTVFMNLINRLIDRPYAYISDAPGCVEITVYNQKDKHRSLIHLLNFQQDLPNIPISNIKVQVRLDYNFTRLIHLPDETEIAFHILGDYLDFTVDRLDTFAMYLLEYKPL